MNHDKPILTVEFLVETDGETEEQYSEQQEREFTITEGMIYDLVQENVKLNPGQNICQTNFFITVKR